MLKRNRAAKRETGSILLATLAFSAFVSQAARAASFVPPATLPDGFALKWTADPGRGLATFEGVEYRDRANSIWVKSDTFGFDMQMADRDGSDRQRHEVKGMNAPGTGDISILQGETWMFVYEMYIPNSLTGGSRFTHIHQMKMVSDAGSSGGPVITLSTSVSGSTQTLLPRVINGFSAIPLSTVWDKWIEITFEYKCDLSGNGGYARWAVRDMASGATLTDQKKSGSVWANEGTKDRRVRPKWGIYRSIESSGLKDCYLLFRNMRAYKKEAVNVIFGKGVEERVSSTGDFRAQDLQEHPSGLIGAGDEIAAFDCRGKLLHKIVLSNNAAHVRDIAGASNGIYILQVKARQTEK